MTCDKSIKKLINRISDKITVCKITALLKYIFSFVLVCVSAIKNQEQDYFAVGFLELLLIFVITNILIDNKIIANVINDILILFFNLQMIILLYANTYLTMVMLTSINSIEDIGGKTVVYITSVLVVLVFSFLPISKVNYYGNKYALLSAILSMELIVTLFKGNGFSPIYGYADLAMQHKHYIELSKSILNAEDTEIDLYNEEIKDYWKADIRAKNSQMSEKPNIILIFTEGLSQNIISDSRNIMPNVKFYQNKSLSFNNYYNHTFATYRGLIGQLYSGYQLSDMDSNPLISIQSILSDEGYNTAFINTEPKNHEFSAYLNSFGFDEVVTDNSEKQNGMINSISDKDAYKLLLKTAKQYGSKDAPFFLSIYTFGTHATLDSPNKKFEDGSNAELNKFYNADFWFGNFMRELSLTELYNNTVIIFTTDHATYKDDSYSASFPDYDRDNVDVDEIPFFIFYNGNVSGHIDAKGRNSLDMVPTVLDFMDISAPNYFLGTSLFAEDSGNICEYGFTDSNLYYSTKEGNVRDMSEQELNEFDNILQDYYVTKELMGKSYNEHND